MVFYVHVLLVYGKIQINRRRGPPPPLTPFDFLRRSRIHERKISLSFLGLRREVSAYNVYIKNQFHTTFAQGGGGGVINFVSRGDCE